MKDGIKEILGSMSEYLEEKKKDYEEIVIKNGFPGDSIVYEVYYEDIKTLLDYITNLQGKVNQYENPDDMTLFYMWLDAKAKDKIKQLQQENERLKELCDKYEEEHNTTFQKWLKELKGGEK